MTISIYDILTHKRDGLKNTTEEIKALIQGFVSGEVADYQMSAWLMAVCINGLDDEETSTLAQAMVASGETIDLSSIPGITVDKHSTGGVGDKTTLVLAPMLASAGLKVAKMSGRGLGITGGTADKLESIPGYSVNLSKEQFLAQARSLGCVLASQTANLVPADKKMYALRDVTGTVECTSLIATSVMSKKIAAGASTILLDVKYGSGAFMKTIENACKLAEIMIGIGKSAGRRTIAALSPMNEPLGMAVGNAIEVAEAIETLRGGGPSDLRELCIELAALLEVATGLDADIPSARTRFNSIIDDGSALEVFKRVIEAQGGDPKVADDLSLLPSAKNSVSITATCDGFIQKVNAFKIGRAAGMLGAGRRRKEDIIDPTAGVLLIRKTGEKVAKGEEVAKLLYSGNVEAELAARLASSAFSIGPDTPATEPLISEVLGL